ncbi:hypothetical protein [Flavobacterium sp. GNP002]|jgi:hypothetical protein
MATGDYKPIRQEPPPINNNINYNDRAYQNECYKNYAFTVKIMNIIKMEGFTLGVLQLKTTIQKQYN